MRRGGPRAVAVGGAVGAWGRGGITARVVLGLHQRYQEPHPLMASPGPPEVMDGPCGPRHPQVALQPLVAWVHFLLPWDTSWPRSSLDPKLASAGEAGRTQRIKLSFAELPWRHLSHQPLGQTHQQLLIPANILGLGGRKRKILPKADPRPNAHPGTFAKANDKAKDCLHSLPCGGGEAAYVCLWSSPSAKQVHRAGMPLRPVSKDMDSQARLLGVKSCPSFLSHPL